MRIFKMTELALKLKRFFCCKQTSEKKENPLFIPAELYVSGSFRLEDVRIIAFALNETLKLNLYAASALSYKASQLEGFFKEAEKMLLGVRVSEEGAADANN
jgi:hypothetical protein